jgi:putative oxidoreductase
MKPTFFGTRYQPMDVDIILLLIRIVLGSAYIIFGWGKIQHPMNWMGPDAVFPGFFQLLAAVSEFVGGIALILGFLTRIAAFGIACTMLVAVYMLRFKFGAPFVNLTGGNGYVTPTVFLLIALLFLINGPGRFSVDHVLFNTKKPR